MTHLFPLFLIFFLTNYVNCYETGAISQKNGSEAKGSDISKSNNLINKTDGFVNTCDQPSCKKITSQMLAMMDHGDICDNFHKEICQGSARNNKNKLALIKHFTQLENNLNKLSDNQKCFANFYKNCQNYDMEFNFLNKMQFIANYTESNLTQIFIDLILTQSMPFFDIGLIIKKIEGNSIYKFQITLPGESYLKTTTRIWQSKENIKVRCLQTIDKSSLDLDKMHKDFKTCVHNKLKSRITGYVEDAKYLMKNGYNGVDVNILVNFLEEVEKIWPNTKEIQQSKGENPCEIINVEDLTERYSIIDWTFFFSKLSNQTISNEENIVFCFNNYTDKLFEIFSKYFGKNDMKSNTSQLVGILRTLYSYQLYENLIIGDMENRQFYCMDLTTQLMPDLTTNIMYEIQNEGKLRLRNMQIKDLFKSLKDTLENSFVLANINENIQDLFQKRLHELSLSILSSSSKFELYEYNQLETDNDIEYLNDTLKLVYKYRNNIYSLVNNNVTSSTLLHYFVSPFDTQPRSFYGTNFIVVHPTFLSYPKDLPEYIRIAKQGIHLAHELVKHFDLIGKSFLNSSDSTLDKYYKALTAKTQGLFNSFFKSPYKLNGKNLIFQHIDGSLLLNEVIVDNGAFRLITDYLKNKSLVNMPWIHETYSPQQITVINSMQEYCQILTPEYFMLNLYENHLLPSDVKIRNILSNYEDFVNLFDCSGRSEMELHTSYQFPYIEVEDDYDIYN